MKLQACRAMRAWSLMECVWCFQDRQGMWLMHGALQEMLPDGSPLRASSLGTMSQGMHQDR